MYLDISKNVYAIFRSYLKKATVDYIMKEIFKLAPKHICEFEIISTYSIRHQSSSDIFPRESDNI